MSKTLADSVKDKWPAARVISAVQIFLRDVMGETDGDYALSMARHIYYASPSVITMLVVRYQQQAADIKALREEAQRIFEQGHYTMQDYDRLKAVLAATDPNRPLGEDA